MGAYLIDHPPARDQFAPRTNWSKNRITGCTVLHTAEGVMDTVGPDTGAEATAEFIRRRADPGSYHDLVDSDTGLTLVPYHLGAYQDGTGSNGFALSLSFACKTTDWARMSPEKRRGFLRQGALKFAEQQAWRKANGHPLTELRRITKAQSDAGASGFIYHGDRDPGRRTDPGKNPPDLFPFDEFIEHCRAALGSAAADVQEDNMPQAISTSVPAGSEAVINIPPSGALGKPAGAAGWGQGWASFVGDCFAKPRVPIKARIGILGVDGNYRPAFGKNFDTTLTPGKRPVITLTPGDQALVVTAYEYPVGVCVEYAKA